VSLHNGNDVLLGLTNVAPYTCSLGCMSTLQGATSAVVLVQVPGWWRATWGVPEHPRGKQHPSI